MSGNMENKIIGGLQKLKKDSRDLKLGAIIQLPKLEELPSEFIIEPLSVKNQIDYLGNNTDACTAFATCGASELQEGIELCPEYTFALTKIGNLKDWGANLRDACKTHIKYGALEVVESPYTYKNKTADVLRDINNWPDLKDLAIKHKKHSFVSISGNYDNFDNIKATLWYFRNEKRSVITGVNWIWNLSSVFLTKKSGNGFGHAIFVIGFKDNYLIIQNSYGKEAGENGRHYLHRDVVNKAVNNYGAFMFIDQESELLKKQYWTFLQIMADYLKILQKYIDLKFKKLGFLFKK